ncbi:hypothetical protein [Pseudanabaena sp. PCC 6802]|uniref:hypothetical protein n=1 Tax=Pseudanabaena sp. PCC 6802 TaxID=118173 RepID=UPI00034DEDDF|nr:hypothetical protein [Pseudanabaena sp. PCC 6802]
MRHLSGCWQYISPVAIASILVASPPAFADREKFTTVSELDRSQTQANGVVIMPTRNSCVQEYPSAPIKGDRAMTRSEVAVGLNNCLDDTYKRYTNGAANLAPKDDLTNLQQRQEQQQQEMTGLQKRIGELESQSQQLEPQQFTVTTKLSGQIGFSLSTTR